MNLRACLAGLVLASSANASTQDAEEGGTANELFQVQCASCHGETGAGDGWTQLDRPARSFRDGGFSFGNTEEAIYRTITSGIPGTPMPSFQGALSDSERRQLAKFVRTLGPPIVEDPSVEERRMHVGSSPVVVRGHLPSIASGAPGRPRGLLIGTPDGFSFEYRVDDVRLLGVRQGDFVERADWISRGGSPLIPLGRLVHTVGRGDPRPTFFRFEQRGGADLDELRCQFRGTRTANGEAAIRYTVLKDATPLAQVVESTRGFGTSVGTGFVRTFRVRAGDRDGLLHMRLLDDARVELIDSFEVGTAHDMRRDEGGWLWFVARVGEGQSEAVAACGVRGNALGEKAGLRIPLRANEVRAVQTTTLLLTDWNAELKAALQQELTQ